MGGHEPPKSDVLFLVLHEVCNQVNGKGEDDGRVLFRADVVEGLEQIVRTKLLKIEVNHDLKSCHVLETPNDVC